MQGNLLGAVIDKKRVIYLVIYSSLGKSMRQVVCPFSHPYTEKPTWALPRGRTLPIELRLPELLPPLLYLYFTPAPLFPQGNSTVCISFPRES